MGNTDTKIQYRKAVIQLTTMNQSIDANDTSFWSQFWSDQISNIQDIYTLIPASEIRALREEAPSNLATLCFKTVERLMQCIDNACITHKDQVEALNCVRLLTRILPYIFEEPEWRGFFWSQSPTNKKQQLDSTSNNNNNNNNNDTTYTDSDDPKKSTPLAQLLLNAISDLLFIPDFTASTCKKSATEHPIDIHALDSCEYIWESGVGFAYSPPHSPQYDYHRVEILKLLLTTFSETMYLPPSNETIPANRWVDYFTSASNRHALPLFTSFLNVVFAYDPIGYGLPYNYILFNDSREPLVEVVAQLLCVTLEQNIHSYTDGSNGGDNYSENINYTIDDLSHNPNLFINYITRIHRDEDFAFILKGFCRLLNNPLIQTYLPGSAKKISFYQELFILFWKFCDLNKKFLYYVLKSSEVLDILVPILFYLVDSRADTSKIGLMHIGVFILLLLSGERNFGVRLNKPYTMRMPMDIPVFTGTHADLLIIIFHKIITTSHQRLQPLYDCLLTIIVNISPYIKSLSMVTSNKLLHLLEAFSSPWFLFSNVNNHHLVFFILEIFNNIIQYQFDGNSNLMYTIIRKRILFYNLLNLNIEQSNIDKILSKQQNKKLNNSNHNNTSSTSSNSASINDSTKKTLKNTDKTFVAKSMEGSTPAKEAEPGTLKTTLAATPSILNMTEKTTPSLTVIDSTQITSPIDTTISTSTSTTLTTNEFSLLNSETQIQSDELFNQEIFKNLKLNDNINGATFHGKSNQEMNVTNGNNNDTNNETVPTTVKSSIKSPQKKLKSRNNSSNSSVFNSADWQPTTEWAQNWKHKLPLQTIMRLLQVLVPQVEKICMDKGLTDETEILKFLQHGTLVGLLPVPHPILIRKYQPNHGTAMWFRTYIWGVIYLRNTEPPIWYDSDVKLFEIQRV